MAATSNHQKPSCPLCGGMRLTGIFRLGPVPVHCNRLWPSAGQARAAPACDIDLAFCQGCALLSNRAFRAELIDYAPGYENALHFSPRFRAYAEELCRDLAERHALAGRDIVEIGCGDGHFLDLMVRNGVRSAIGFDPAMAGRASPFAGTPGVEVLPQSFRADRFGRPFDAIVCRHVLEHLPNPLALLLDIRAALGDRSCLLYFEVPNAEWMLESCSLWDLIYEHTTYWTQPSLDTLFRRAGFAPARIRAGYGGQFLMLEAEPARPEPDCLPSAAQLEAVRRPALELAGTAPSVLADWRRRLQDLARQGRTAAIWGAGSKGITFANAVDGRGDCVKALVDLNAGKHGLFAPGVALPVIPPERVAALAPDLVLIANEIYAPEIARMLGEMGCAAEIRVIKA